MSRPRRAALASLLLALAAPGVSCRPAESRLTTTPPTLAPPAWASDAIWYQIMVERFRNGDPHNDPTAADIQGFTPEPVPAGWATTPWSHDWYALDPWARAAGKDFYGSAQFRRYGGDLQGVLDELDYLQRLGVTAIFLNPVNDAPSLHKYDARYYQHVDHNFGPDPAGDERRMAAGDPSDAATWGWTAADSLLLRLIGEVHRRGMRIILDYSWNHTGVNAPTWKDLVAKQRQSKYADWYAVERFDDPATPDTNEFSYRGWAGVPSLPEWKKVGRPAGRTKGAIEGTMVPGVIALVEAVSRRWLDPNGDGDPADGVDGFRLDVADVVPLGFWREYRRFVRSVNPAAYLVGEVWWEEWPDRLFDPAPWARDDVFDAVMHYQWYDPTRRFFAQAAPPLTASQYAAALDSLGAGISVPHQRAMMNLTASHDTPRFSTSIYNPGRYKYHNRPSEDAGYRTDRPDARTRAIQEQILVQQFTWIGAPHIWNGDEVGMWGADDPDERKPMVWGDLRYDDERADVLGRPRPANRVAPDTALFGLYQRLIALRKAHARLFADGERTWLVTDDAKGLLAYARLLGTEQAVVAFNRADRPQAISVPAEGRYHQVYPAGESVSAVDGRLSATLAPRTARVWLRE